ALRIAPLRPDFNELELAAVLPAAVREPALYVRGPRDQRIAMPEAHAFAKPAAHVLAKARYCAVERELTIKLHLAQRVVGAAHELHAARHNGDIELARAAGTGPPAQQAFGTAEHQRVLRG